MVFVSVRVHSFPPPVLLWEIISWVEVEQLVTERGTMGLKAKCLVCLGVTTEGTNLQHVTSEAGIQVADPE